MGVLSAVLVRNETTWNYLVNHRRWIYGLAALLLLALAAITLGGYSVGSSAGTKTLYGLELSVLAFFYSAVLLAAVTRQDQFVGTILCNSLLMRLGGIAYGTYLLHHLCIDFFHFLVVALIRPAPAAAFIGAQMLGVALAITLAIVSWRYFEKPLVRRGHAFDY